MDYFEPFLLRKMTTVLWTWGYILGSKGLWIKQALRVFNTGTSLLNHPSLLIWESSAWAQSAGWNCVDPGHSKERLEFAVSQACRHEAHPGLDTCGSQVRFLFHWVEFLRKTMDSLTGVRWLYGISSHIPSSWQEPCFSCVSLCVRRWLASGRKVFCVYW